jgi:hypothetical protein
MSFQGITRHQLFLHPDIPYTSHNSSACIELLANGNLPAIYGLAADFVTENSASGSDPGLCIALAEEVGPPIVEFGQTAQKDVVTKEEAISLSEKAGISLRELGGTGGGIIGALSAVGLRASGNDGRFIRLKGIRKLQGVVTAGEIIARTAVEHVIDPEGRDIPANDLVNTFDWVRPRLHNNQAVLFVEPAGGQEQAWITVDRRKCPKPKNKE